MRHVPESGLLACALVLLAAATWWLERSRVGLRVATGA